MPFGIKQKDRARHMYVIGKTGMGKSTLLENMAIQDIQNGEGLCFIDPHGGTVDKLLDYIPEHRVKDVVYFAPFDLEYPIAFNIMEDVGYDKRHLVVSGLMAAFKKIWVDAWSARMEYILTNTLLALLEYPDATLLGVNRMYTDKGYRKKVVENIKDPVVKDFWIKEFMTYTDRYTQEATPAIQNKIGQFTSNPLIRNIIGQSKSSFDIRTLMDERKILIINLSKGLVGDTNTQLLGSMLTTRIFLAAMSRADLSARDLARLPNFYFYVDEFQNFANETFAEILSEARKYKLNLVIAHQYIEQMEEEVRDAVFGNVGTTVSFRVGPFDAETLETVFSPEFLQEDLVNLGFAQIYLSLMIDGIGSRPFSASTIPSIEPPPRSYRKEVLASSRTVFATPRDQIETAIFTELATVSEAGVGADEPKPSRRGPMDRRAPAARDERPRSPRDVMKKMHDERPRPIAAPVKPEEPLSTPDLKSLLENITTKVEENAQRERAEQGKEIGAVIQRTVAPPTPAPREPQQPPRPPQQRQSEKPRAQPQPQHPAQPRPQAAPQQEPVVPPVVSQNKKVFELSEEELRAVFKDTL